MVVVSSMGKLLVLILLLPIVFGNESDTAKVQLESLKSVIVASSSRVKSVFSLVDIPGDGVSMLVLDMYGAIKSIVNDPTNTHREEFPRSSIPLM